MTASRSILKSALAALWLFAGAAAAQTIEIGLDEGRALAQRAVLTGQFPIARDLARGLIEADAEDRAAWIVLAATLPRLGEAPAGRAAGRQALRLSETDAQRYEAARLIALAAAAEDRYTLAQFWLRRAATFAPDDPAYAQNRSDFQMLRRLNPWSGRLQLSFAHSDNVNGGSDDLYNVIDGLPIVGVLSPEARALSGFVTTADLTFSRRLGQSETQLTALSGRLYTRQVWLDDAARTIAPEAENGDFASTRAELDLRHAMAVGDGVLGAEATLGAAWFGGALDYPFARIEADWSARAAPRLRYGLSLGFEQQYDPESWDRDNRVVTLGGVLGYRFESGARLTARLSFSEVHSDNLNERSQATLAQLTWRPAEPLGPARLSLSLGASLSDYPDYTLVFPVPGGRQDERLFGSVEAVFTDWSYAGFAPVVTLAGQTTDSNVSRFDRDELSIRFSFRSTF